MTTIAVPTAADTDRPPARRKWWVWVLPLAVAGAAAAGYWGVTNWYASRGGPTVTVKWQPVAVGEMQVKVHKDGELASVNNIEVVSLVEGISTIVQIVKEGTFVAQGDVLVQLDSSAIRQKIEDTTLELQRARSDVATAANALEIQKSQNEANLEAAKVDVELAKLSIKQYTDGTFPAERDQAATTVKMAQITRDNKVDDLKQIRDLFAKNFVNLADVKQAELAVATTENELAKAESTLSVLTKYTHPMMLAGKNSYMKQTEQKLVRTQVENNNNLTKATTALETQEAAHKILERRMERLKEQLEYCTIKAPSSGLVVYNSNIGRGDSSAPIQEGTQVRERQVILRLPDTSAMKAVVRINEGQVIRLRPDQRAVVRITGMREPIGASLTRISPVSDSSSRWLNPDTREYPVELTLDWTPPNLKPGIGVQVEIEVDNIPDATTVPLQAIYSAGADNFVFARDAATGEPLPRKVNIGVANETQVRVVDGLKAGEQVALLQAGQGRDLLEKAGIVPSTDEPKVRRGPNGAKGKKDPAPGGKQPQDPQRDEAPGGRAAAKTRGPAAQTAEAVGASAPTRKPGEVAPAAPAPAEGKPAAGRTGGHRSVKTAVAAPLGDASR